jgi:hypothetical protein
MFSDRVALSDVVLMGHSRGGEAILGVGGEVDVSPWEAPPPQGVEIEGHLSVAPTDWLKGAYKPSTEKPFLVLVPAADGDVRELKGARHYDRSTVRNRGGWFQSQMYIYGGYHNGFNTEWGLRDGILMVARYSDLISDNEHEKFLEAWGPKFVEKSLSNYEANPGVFSGDAVIEELKNEKVYPSYLHRRSRLVDNHENSTVATNTLGGQVGHNFSTQSSEVFSQYPFTASSQAYNDTFFHDTDGLIGVWDKSGREFAYHVPTQYRDVTGFDYLSFRVTQVYDGPTGRNDLDPMELGVGLRDGSGLEARVSSAKAGRIPSAFEIRHNDSWRHHASMMRTVRVPLSCMAASSEEEGEAMNMSSITRVQFDTATAESGIVGIDNVSFSR